MKQVRIGTFETNSSSTHSMIIPTEKPDIKIGDELRFRIDEFGWSIEEVNHLDYLYTALMCTTDKESSARFKQLKRVCKENGIEARFDTAYYTRWDSDYNEKGEPYFDLADGYIDHQGDLGEFLDTVFESDSNLLNFILGGRVGTGNDNSDEDNPVAIWYDNLPKEEQKKYIYCYKGN